jgi:hypothetical protein
MEFVSLFVMFENMCHTYTNKLRNFTTILTDNMAIKLNTEVQKHTKSCINWKRAKKSEKQ